MEPKGKCSWTVTNALKWVTGTSLQGKLVSLAQQQQLDSLSASGDWRYSGETCRKVFLDGHQRAQVGDWHFLAGEACVTGPAQHLESLSLIHI